MMYYSTGMAIQFFILLVTGIPLVMTTKKIKDRFIGFPGKQKNFTERVIKIFTIWCALNLILALYVTQEYVSFYKGQ